MASPVGLSFPPRIGVNGGWVLSVANNVDTTHIKEAVKLALLTRLGERVMEYEQGSRVAEAVFENMDETLVSVLEYKIQDALDQLEPRISVNTVDVAFDQDNAQVLVTISYTVIDSGATDLMIIDIGTQD